jgi:hypothetical protein
MPGPYQMQKNAHRLQLKKSLKARGPLGPGRRVGQYRKAGLTPPPPPGQLKAKQSVGPKPINSVVQPRPAVTRPSLPDRTPSGVQGIAQPKPRPALRPVSARPVSPGGPAWARPVAPGNGLHKGWAKRQKKASRVLGKPNAPKKARRWARRVQGRPSFTTSPITYR